MYFQGKNLGKAYKNYFKIIYLNVLVHQTNKLRRPQQCKKVIKKVFLYYLDKTFSPSLPLAIIDR